MAISDIAARRKPPTEWQTCAVCSLLAGLPDDEAAVLVDLLSDTTVRYEWLADELTNDGHPIAASRLSRHARGQCSAKTRLRGGK